MRFQLRRQRKATLGSLKCLLFLIVASAMSVSGCGTIPDARALLHDKQLYNKNSNFAGPNGALTAKQGEKAIDRLKDRQETPSDILERHLAFEQALSDIPLVVGNKVTILENGPPTYQAMLAAIHSAQDNINIQMYIFSDGPIGKMFADALIERQRHGVQVNLAYDSLGSLTTPASFFDELRKNGVAVMQYRPVNPLAAKLPWTLSHRSHRKMLVVDGRIAFTGGINISEVYDSGSSGSSGGSSQSEASKSKEPLAYWRDTDIQLEGPAVAQLQHLFIDEWNHQQGPMLSARNYFPQLEKQGNQIVRVIASVPQRFSLIYVDLISAVVNSETNVYITDAYFAPDHQMLHALEHAAQRGVDVRLLLPSQSDGVMVVSAARSHYAALLKAGVKIYEWQGEMLHAKTVTIDGVWSTVGTSNLDWWSIARNNEVNVIVLSHSFGDEMNLMFKNDMERSKEINLEEWKHRGLHERFNETIAGMIEPLL